MEPLPCIEGCVLPIRMEGSLVSIFVEGPVCIMRMRARSAALEFGRVTPGMLPGATAIQTPSPMKPPAATRVKRSCLTGASFWTKMTPATTAIQNRLITPTAKSASMMPQQQPTQYAPCSAPIRKEPAQPAEIGAGAGVHPSHALDGDDPRDEGAAQERGCDEHRPGQGAHAA